jgi:hypothetical protein
MNTLGIEKRTVPLFVRISLRNKMWIKLMAKQDGVREAVFVDALLSAARKKDASHAKKSKRCT